MYHDLAESELNGERHFGVVVIGSGPAGLTLAKELSDKGEIVALISSGNGVYDLRNQDLYKGEIPNQLPAWPLHASRLRMFGGTSNHWTGHCGPYDSIDFQARDFVPNSGWLVTRDELESYYRSAQNVIGLGTYDYSPTRLDNKLDFSFAQNGFSEGVLAFNPKRFGPDFREDLEGRSNCLVIENANLTKINLNPDGKRVSSLEVRSLNGNVSSITCDSAVLACGGVENARLLLHTDLAQSLECIGRYYSFHPRLITGTFYLSEPIIKENAYQWQQTEDGIRKIFVKYTSESQAENRLPNYAMNLLNRSDPNHPAYSAALRVRNKIRGDSYEGDLSDDLLTILSGFGALVKQYTGRKLEGHTSSFNLMTYVDPTPRYENHIELIDELDELGLRRCRANWTPAEDDINNTVDFNSRFGALVGASGLGRVQVVDGLDREEIFSNLVRQSSGGGHQMGTTRMSNDSSTGVVDANLKVHGVENLYCAGSSVFPTFSWVNPTMTIVALSIRLAAHLSQVKQ